MLETGYLAAFLVGLLGGVHCVGMCGGIVGVLGMGSRPGIGVLLGYNLGRIASYTLAGALLGGVAALAASLADIRQAQQVLQIIAGLFMLAMGLYLGGWWFGLLKLERAGGLIWRHIQPTAQRLLPVRGAGQALLLGAVWGWLPCGLVYSVLIWSVSSGGAIEGGLLMLAFGLGTLPNLFAMGLVADKLRPFLQRVWVRRLAGGLVFAFGLVSIFRAL